MSRTPTGVPTCRMGASGLVVSRLCLGTMTFGLQTDETGSFEILDKALAAGVHFIDTADVYPFGGTWREAGGTEAIIGRWMAARKTRGQVILATKASGKTGPAPWDKGNSRQHLLDAIDGSLKRLGTDHVDLLQLHADDPNVPLDETLEALDTIVRSGRARYIGASNFVAWRIAKALGISARQGLAHFVCLQPRYNLLFRVPERELLPMAAEEGLGVMTYNPLAGGLLTGKHRVDAGPAAGTRFTLGTAAKMYSDRYWHEREFASVQALEAAVKDSGAPLTRVAVAWVLANPAITSVIIGASRAAQLDETIASATWALDPALKQRLDEITHEYRTGDVLR